MDLNLMKESKYNYVIQEDGNYIYYNSISGKIFVSSSPIGDLILNSNQLKVLSNYKFIVPIDANETNNLNDNCKYLLNEKQLCITIIPSFKCNFDCLYCYEAKENTEITLETISNLVDFVQRNIHRYKSVHFTFFGGEPLLFLDKCLLICKQIQSICRNQSKAFFSNFVTNGYLLNSEVAYLLYKCRCSEIQITLDGTQESHDKYRHLHNGNPSFNKILDNLLALRDVFFRYRIKVLIRINVTEENASSIPSLVETIKQLKYKVGYMTAYLYPIKDWGGDLRISEKALMDHNSLIQLKNKFYTKDNPYVDTSFILPGNNICFGFFNYSFAVLPDGHLTNCTVRYNQNKLTNSLKSLQIHDNYSLNPRFLHDKRCLDCKLVGTCFGLNCTEGDCEYENKLSELKLIIKYLYNTNRYLSLEEL